MKTIKPIMKTSAIALFPGLGLAGCVAVPVHDAPYGPALYSAPAVVVQPYIGLGFGYYGRGYYGGRGGHRGRYGRW
jgi:hypothetical protein